MDTVTPYPGTQAVLRAIALLKAFTADDAELSLADLSRRVGLNKTTAFRLMTALESEGMVMRNPATDAYRLGPQVIVLGGHAQRSNDLLFASRAAMQELADLTGEAVTLEVLAGNSVVVMAEVAGQYVLGASQSVGTRWPAAQTSTGKVLLAYLTVDQLERLTLTNELRRELPAIRQQGYTVVDGELEADFIAIAAPIYNPYGEVIAAVSAGGPSTRLTPQRTPEVIRMVVDTAARISRQLGFA